MAIRIPIYSSLSPKHRQYANLAAGGVLLTTVALVVSNFIGPSTGPGGPPPELPKPKPLGGTPGSALDPKDAWMGGAGKEVAQLKVNVRDINDKLTQVQGEFQQTAQALRSQMSTLMSQGIAGTQAAQQQQAAAAAAAATASSASPGRVAMPTPPMGQPAMNGPAPMPNQRTVGYPPGTPNGNAGISGAPAGMAAPAAPAVPALLRVSVRSAAEPAADPSQGAPGAVGTGPNGRPAPPRIVGQFLPVGFTPAVLLGGLAAPTGGQAQSNPIPVLLRLTDLSVLPNGFRGRTKGCLVIGEGYGDHSAERAYIRATLLSCVMHDGRVLETGIVGSVFGDDGMNGLSGRLVTKQGAILGNALLAGLASGFGSGIAAATTTTSNTALGTVTSTPTDANSILKMGFGTGVSKALDRMSQYWISLAEKTFPVVEVQPGRPVDLVLQKGVSLEAALGALGPSGAAPAAARGAEPDNDRSALLRAAVSTDDSD